MKVKLLRISGSATETLGVLLIDGHPLFATLELPWKENKQSISCIPTGSYTCIPFYSKRFGSVFKVLKVDGRFDILFHVGNGAKDTHGCILVGKSFRLNSRGQGEVANSKLAIDELRVLLGGENSFLLDITD